MIRPRRDSNPGPLGQKSSALTTDPKSRLFDAVVRDWLHTQKLCMICFMQIFVIHPNFEEVIIYETQSQFLAKQSPIPDVEPHLTTWKPQRREIRYSWKRFDPNGIRTQDLLVKSPVLQPLSQRVDSLTQLSETEYIHRSYAWSALCRYS